MNAEDVEELRRLAGLSTRPLVAKRLTDLATEASAALATAASAPTATPPPAAAAATTLPKPLAVGTSVNVSSYTKISSYAWDQSADSVKLFVTLPNVESLPADATKVYEFSGPRVMF